MSRVVEGRSRKVLPEHSSSSKSNLLSYADVHENFLQMCILSVCGGGLILLIQLQAFHAFLYGLHNN